VWQGLSWILLLDNAENANLNAKNVLPSVRAANALMDSTYGVKHAYVNALRELSPINSF
jgi:hypothetical protein